MNASATSQVLGPSPVVLVIEDKPGDAYLIRQQLLSTVKRFWCIWPTRWRVLFTGAD